jgi:hypothetical protein
MFLNMKHTTSGGRYDIIKPTEILQEIPVTTSGKLRITTVSHWLATTGLIQWKNHFTIQFFK